MKRFADLPDLVLGPLTNRPDADWYAASPGKWCAAQIVEHLALALDWSAAGFEERRARDPMVRRPRTVVERAARLLVMGLGWFPPGLEAPANAVPAARVARAAVEAHFRSGVERHLVLARLLVPARAHDLYVKHGRMGDLSFPEWLEFHVHHARHHARQIRARIPA
jgi:Protein of unknown function (DUF1569)